MYNIPTSITIQDKSFGIRNKGDYRVVLDCFSALNDTELTDQERMIAALIIFYLAWLLYCEHGTCRGVKGDLGIGHLSHYG